MSATIQSGLYLSGSNFQGHFCHAASLPVPGFPNPRTSTARPRLLLYLQKTQLPVLMDSF
jgi:hypothetical protein